MPALLRTIATLSILTTVASCASQRMAYLTPDQLARQLTKPICADAWKAISYSSTKDTPRTIEEVRANNRARKAFCSE